MILAKGDVNGMLTSRHYREHNEYFGFDFSGKILWVMDGEKYYIDPSELKGEVVKIEHLDKEMDKSGHFYKKIVAVPSDQTLDILTGEIK